MTSVQALESWQVYISIPLVKADIGSALTAGHFEKPKVTKGSNPLHSVPRLGSACLHSGLAPWARRHRPSMAGGGYLGIHAEVPTAQDLRSASG